MHIFGISAFSILLWGYVQLDFSSLVQTMTYFQASSVIIGYILPRAATQKSSFSFVFCLFNENTYFKN